MKNLRTVLFVASMFLVMLNEGYAQELSFTKSTEVNINNLPEYVIVTSQNTKLLGGIGVTIDAKKSSYKKQLLTLNDLLQDSDKLKIRNQTDLLNAMSKLGYEFVDAYNASQVVNSREKEDVVDDIFNEIDGGKGVFRVNMIFRKKEKFRV